MLAAVARLYHSTTLLLQDGTDPIPGRGRARRAYI